VGDAMMDTHYSLPGSQWRSLLFSKLDFSLNALDVTLRYADIFRYGKRISIVAGELFPGFYNDPNLLESIKNSARLGASIKVLFGPALYVESDKFLKFALENERVELYKRNNRERSHFKIIEDWNGRKFALVDEPHRINVDKRESFLLTHDYLDKIEFLENIFLKRIQKAEKVDKDTIIDRFSAERGKTKKDQWKGFISNKDKKEVDTASDKQILELKQMLFAN
jgi:hypothetical protein